MSVQLSVAVIFVPAGVSAPSLQAGRTRALQHEAHKHRETQFATHGLVTSR